MQFDSWKPQKIAYPNRLTLVWRRAYETQSDVVNATLFVAACSLLALGIRGMPKLSATLRRANAVGGVSRFR